MNPRYRRLLIPGLLLVLVVVVVVASLARRADAADEPGGTPVSVLSDPRITEASGLAISKTSDDLAYVINDSGNTQQVYAVTISTGDVVGTTTVTGGQWRDTEALSIDDDGMLWVADTGDNFVDRDDAALYAFPEPGAGERTVTATRYPVSYEGGSEDVEALLIQPGTGAKYLVSKGFVSGSFYALPDALSTSTTNVAERVGRAPGVVTDGAFTPDGAKVLLRTYAEVREFDPADWKELRTIYTAPLQQSETLAVERSGRTFLIGSEGASSPLVRVAVSGASAAPSTTPSPTPSPVPIDDNGDPRPNQGFAGRSWFGVGFAMLFLLGISVWIARKS